MRKLLKTFAIVGAICVGLLLILLVAAAIFLANLDSPAIKSWLLTSVEDATGIELDYRSLSLNPLTGLRIEGLALKTPAPLRQYAKNLLRIESLDVGWDLFSLAGAGKRVSLTVQKPRIVVVRGANGKTSLDLLLGPPKPKEKERKPTPLSELPGMLDRLGIVAERIQAEDASLEFLRETDRGVETSLAIGGLNLDGSLWLTAPGSRLKLRLGGTSKNPWRIELSGGRSVRLKGETTLGLEKGILRLHMSFQTLGSQGIPQLRGVSEVVRASALAKFDRRGHKVTLDLEKLDLLSGAILADLRADVYDRPTDGAIAAVHSGKLSVDWSRLPAWVHNRAKKYGRVEGLSAQAHLGKLQILQKAPWIRLGGSAWVRLSLGQANLSMNGQSVQVQGLKAALSASARANGEIGVRSEIAVEGLMAAKGLNQVKVSGVGMRVDLPGLGPDLMPLRGDADLTLHVESLEARTKTAAVVSGPLTLSLRAPPVLQAPLSATASLKLQQVRAKLPGGKTLSPGGPIELAVRADGMKVPPDRPASATGNLSLQLTMPGNSIELDLHRKSEALVRLGFSVQAHDLRPFSALLPRRKGMKIALAPLRVDTSGDVSMHDPLSHSRRVKGKIQVGLEGISASVSGRRFYVRKSRIGVDLDLRGMRRGRADLELTLDWPRIEGHVLLERATTTAQVRLGHTIGLKARMKARRGGSVVLDSRVAAHVNRGMGWSSWEVQARLSGLGGVIRDPSALAPLGRKGLRLAGIELESSGRAWLRTLSRPSRARLEQRTSVALSGVSLRRSDMAVEVPSAALTVETNWTKGGGRTNASLSIPVMRARKDRDSYTLEGLNSWLRSDFQLGEDDMPQTASLQAGLALEQATGPFSATYPVSGLSVELDARLHGKAVTLRRLDVQNPGSGTVLELHGRLSGFGKGGNVSGFAAGKLSQECKKLQAASVRPRGRLEVPFRMESEGASLFKVEMALRASGVSLDLGKIKVQGLRGVIPVVEEVSLASGRPVLIQNSESNLYSLVRYLDMHPFLSQEAYMALDRLDLGPASIGPMAANLRVLRNTFSLDQLQATWRGGNISGQLVVEYNEHDPRLYFRGRITGVRPTEGSERLSANAALYLSVGKQELGGRLHLIHIGKRHLLDLLDALDPYHEDVSINKVRKLLGFAYPKYVRIRLDQGFLSAKVALGGLGGLVNIQELRGVPTGPLLRKVLKPLAHGGEP